MASLAPTGPWQKLNMALAAPTPALRFPPTPCYQRDERTPGVAASIGPNSQVSAWNDVKGDLTPESVPGTI